MSDSELISNFRYVIEIFWLRAKPSTTPLPHGHSVFRLSGAECQPGSFLACASRWYRAIDRVRHA